MSSGASRLAPNAVGKLGQKDNPLQKSVSVDISRTDDPTQLGSWDRKTTLRRNPSPSISPKLTTQRSWEVGTEKQPSQKSVSVNVSQTDDPTQLGSWDRKTTLRRNPSPSISPKLTTQRSTMHLWIDL
ncbi:hypothetical protein AB3N59_18405 [Leptospira sp. WS92.C1]